MSLVVAQFLRATKDNHAQLNTGNGLLVAMLLTHQIQLLPTILSPFAIAYMYCLTVCMTLIWCLWVHAMQKYIFAQYTTEDHYLNRLVDGIYLCLSFCYFLMTILSSVPCVRNVQELSQWVIFWIWYNVYMYNVDHPPSCLPCRLVWSGRVVKKLGCVLTALALMVGQERGSRLDYAIYLCKSGELCAISRYYNSVGEERICGNFSVTINPVYKLDCPPFHGSKTCSPGWATSQSWTSATPMSNFPLDVESRHYVMLCILDSPSATPQH